MEDLSGIFTSLGTPTLAAALRSAVYLVLGLVSVRILLRLLMKLCARSKTLQPVSRHIRSFAKALLLTLLAMVVLDSLGVHVTSFVALLGVAGLAVSLALQNVLANVAGGIILLTTKPFAVGEYVSLGDIEGTVRMTGLSYTVLVTVDNKEVYVPNSELSTRTVTNYYRLGVRRLDLRIGVSYDAPTEAVKEALLSAADALPQRDASRPAVCYLEEFGDSAVNYLLCVWVDAKCCLTSRYALNELVRDALDRRGIEIPYSHLNIHMLSK